MSLDLARGRNFFVLTKTSAASGDENVLVIIQKLWMRTIIRHMISEVIVKCLRLLAVSSLNISVLICYHPLVSNSSLRLSTFVCKRGVIKSRTGVFRWGFP